MSAQALSGATDPKSADTNTTSAPGTTGAGVQGGNGNESVLSSAGAIGKQFNPDGNIGQIGEKVGGPFSSEGVIGSQFDASKSGIAGQVEKLVDGPAQK